MSLSNPPSYWPISFGGAKFGILLTDKVEEEAEEEGTGARKVEVEEEEEAEGWAAGRVEEVGWYFDCNPLVAVEVSL